MALEDRLRRLEEEIPEPLCGERPPCQRITRSLVAVYPDGTEELVEGQPKAPLCEGCPSRDDPNAPVRHILITHPADA